MTEEKSKGWQPGFRPPFLARSLTVFLALAGMAASTVNLLGAEPAGAPSSPMSKQGDRQRLPDISWRASYRPGAVDAMGNLLGGTEIRALVPFDGKLYAAVGYWTDKEAGKPNNPGAQVLVLDRPEPAGGRWRQDLHLGERIAIPGQYHSRRRYLAISVMAAVVFARNARGEDLPRPAPLLMAGVWDLHDGIEAFSRDASGAGSWQRSVIEPSVDPANPKRPRAHIRSFGFHRDAVTGVDRIFAGSSGRANRPRQIYSGTYDPGVPGRIAWGRTPEPWEQEPGPNDRVTSFAEANGRLYASVCGKIYERTDGQSPRWRLALAHPKDHAPPGPGEWGFRGLTAFPGEAGSGDRLLAAFEGDACAVGAVDPKDFSSARQELDVVAFLKERWRRPWVGYCIVAYNRFAPVALPSGEQVHLAGLEARISPDGKDPASWHGWERGAWFLARFPDGAYDLQEIVDHSLQPKPDLVATRAIAPSPFPEEARKTVVYAGGFDCNHVEGVNHNTAWIYRGEIKLGPEAAHAK